MEEMELIKMLMERLILRDLIITQGSKALATVTLGKESVDI